MYLALLLDNVYISKAGSNAKPRLLKREIDPVKTMFLYFWLFKKIKEKHGWNGFTKYFVFVKSATVMKRFDMSRV